MSSNSPVAMWAKTNMGWNVYAPIGMDDDSLVDDYQEDIFELRTP